MTEKEVEAGKAALREAVANDTFLKALAFIYRSIPAMECDCFSENPYRNAYYSGQRSVGLTIKHFLGKDNFIKLDLIKL